MLPSGKSKNCEMKSSTNLEKAKAALFTKFTGTIDSKGYTRFPQDNLVLGVRLEQFKDDLLQGSGNELRTKFCAVHSSSALAVNCFAPSKESPNELVLLGQRGAVNVRFEKQLRIFSRGTPANLDVWGERKDGIIAIESKLLEYFKLKKPVFSKSYEHLEPPFSEPCWWAIYSEAKQALYSIWIGHVGQALLRVRKLQHSGSVTSKLTLLYIFWEPLNWKEINECKFHRKEVEAFAEAVSSSEISFRWSCYNDVWEEWIADPVLAQHAQNLKARYAVYL